MDEYKDIIDRLTPRRDIKASEALRGRIRRSIEKERRRSVMRKCLVSCIGISAVASILALLFVPSGISAREVLSAALDALRKTESIEMTVDVRTRAMENFRYINVQDGFVRHKINIYRSDSISLWRIDKGDRAAIGENADIYSWIRPLKIGWHIDRQDEESALGYLSTLLSPARILETELEHCVNGSDAEYSVTKSGNDILLTVHSKPQGNFENPYMLNTSIVESENVRRYVIDAFTKQLKTASVSIVSGNKETAVLRIMSISYDARYASVFSRPSDIVFVETEHRLHGLSGLSAEEAASTVLNAFSKWNREIIDSVFDPSVADAVYKEHLCGSSLVSVGVAFQSGDEDDTFVPYTLRLKNGMMKRHNLVLQKSDTGGWIVVGGL